MTIKRLMVLSALMILVDLPLAWASGPDWYPELPPRINCKYYQDWNKYMHISQYKDACDGAIELFYPCDLNFEKACINGVEVDFGSRFGGVFQDEGFTSRASQGLSEKDFSNPAKMYDPITLPGGKSINLCNKIEGLSKEDVTKLDFNHLPKDKNFTIESVPAFIKPNKNIGPLSYHWKIRVADGHAHIDVEIQSLKTFKPFPAGKTANPEMTKASVTDGEGIDEVNRILFGDHLVRCKSVNSVIEDKNIPLVPSITKSNEDSLSDSKQVYEALLPALQKSGLNTTALKANFENVFNIKLQVEEPVPAPASNSEKAVISKPVPKSKRNSSRSSKEDIYWQSVQSKDTPEEYQSYLDNYPKGTFAELARIRIANSLKQKAGQNR